MASVKKCWGVCSNDYFLVVYDLDQMVFLKKIKVSNIGSQDEGFAITPDGKYLYNIEKPFYSTKTRLTIYDTLNFSVVKTLFQNDDKMVLKSLELDQNNGYVLGFMRDDTGVFDYGFVAQLVKDKITNVKKLEKERFDDIRAYKSWEEYGFTKKALEWSILKDKPNIEAISLKEVFTKLDASTPNKKSFLARLFKKSS